MISQSITTQPYQCRFPLFGQPTRPSSITFIVTTIILLSQASICQTAARGAAITRSPEELRILAGHKISLACNITFPVNDHILLILWYKSDINGSPIYTIDGRYKDEINGADHFKSPELGERASVDIKSSPISLTIDPVKETDDGLYFCRVDFKWARTSSASIKLSVLVPPSKLSITNVNGIPFRKLAGPFNQGETALIKCIATGGKPPPSLIWYQNEKIIDTTYNISSKGSEVENILLITNLERSHLFQEFTCQAQNEAYNTLTATISLEINLKPLSVSITSLTSPLRIGLKSKFTCKTHGSRPPAIISWYLNNRTLPYSRESYSEDGNYSSSTLELVHSRSMDGTLLVCRAVNKRIPGSTLQDELKLDIQYPPICKENQRLTYPASIGELIDLTCEVNANPTQVTFWWGKKVINESHDSPASTSDQIGVSLKSEPLKTILKLNVETMKDFAVYWCKARNSIGQTVEPCYFTVEPQDPPRKPKSCTVRDDGLYLAVNCIPDFASSSVDYFVLEAYEDNGQILLDKVNETASPDFELTNLESNGSYILVTYAINKFGKSSDLVIPLRKAKSTSSHLHISSVKEINPKEGPISPMLGAISIICIISFLILSILCLLIILIRCKLSRKQSKRKKKVTISEPENKVIQESFQESFHESNQTPDVIPFKEPDLDDIKECFENGSIKIPETFITEAYIQLKSETIDSSPIRKYIENIAITSSLQESYRSTPV